MKKILFLLLCSVVMYGQVPADATPIENIQLTNNVISNGAPFVSVQESSGVVNKITKTELQDAFYFATASALPVVGITDKLYITRDDNKLYRFNGTIYVPLSADISGKEDIANKQNSLAVDATNLKYPTVTAVNAGLATKQNTISGTTNVVPKFNTGGLVNSTILEDANGVLIQGDYVGANIAPLIIRNTAANTAANISQIWQNSTGTAVGTLRSDGFFSATGSMNSPVFVATSSGSANLNIFRLNGQNGTGVFFPPTNILAFSTNAVERLRIHSSGRFSFGSTTDDGVNIAQFNGTVKASPAVTSDQLATLGQVNTVDANNVKLTGFQEITGLKSYRPASGATGLQVIATAGATGVGVLSDSQTTGYTAFRANTNGTGFNFEGQNNGTTTYTVDKLGVVTLVGGTTLNNAVPRSQLLYNSQTITANKTVTIAEFVNNNELILSVDATSGNITVTLPTFNDLRGYKVTVKKMDSSANSVLITGVDGINIDGAATLVISGQYGTATVGANLAQYIIL